MVGLCERQVCWMSDRTQPTTPRLAVYTIVPLGKYAAQGTPSFAHVYRDGTLCHQANGRNCVALCEVWLDEHDPIRQAVRAGMLIPLEVCIRRPEACAYAHHHEVVCTAMGGRAAEMDAAWYVCRGVGRDAAAEAAATKEGEQ